MTTTKTADVECYIGTASQLLTMNRFLTIALNGATSVTNEAVLGKRDEEASVHAAMYTVAIDTMYDNATVDTLRTLVGSESNVAIITPNCWYCLPIDIPAMPQASESAAPLTSSFSMGQRARGRYGTSEPEEFELSGSGASLTHTIDLTGVEFVHVIVTATSGTGTFDIGTSSAHGDIPLSLGIHRVAIPTAGRTSSARIARSAAGAEGYVLVGDDQYLPSG